VATRESPLLGSLDTSATTGNSNHEKTLEGGFQESPVCSPVEGCSPSCVRVLAPVAGQVLDTRELLLHFTAFMDELQNRGITWL